jgi:hypothetical protein
MAPMGVVAVVCTLDRPLAEDVAAGETREALYGHATGQVLKIPKAKVQDKMIVRQQSETDCKILYVENEALVQQIMEWPICCQQPATLTSYSCTFEGQNPLFYASFGKPNVD